jgi:hypothetical protein
MKVGDTVRMMSNFECPGQDTIEQGTEARLCGINEFDKIGTIDLGDSMPVVPLQLLAVVNKDIGKPKHRWEVEDANQSSEGSLRYNKGKLPMHLVPPSAIEALAAVLEYGANKYEDRNWEKGAEYSVPYASLMRHLLAFWSGQDKDAESGLPHTYHILMNAAMLVQYEQMDKDLDDRPNK